MYFRDAGIALLVSRSLLALVRCHSVEWRHGASRSSQTSRSGGRFRVPVQSSTELRLLQSMTFVGGRAHLQACGATPLLRFWLLQHCPTAESTCEAFPRRGPGLPLPVRSVPRVSHPLDGFLLGQSARPCFMPERSWSSLPYRAFPSSGAGTPLDVHPAFVPVGCRRPRPDTPPLGNGHSHVGG
jgi:hypothetical protein